MDLRELFGNKTIPVKEKTAIISQWLLQQPKEINQWLAYTKTAQASGKATCIEALENASRENPGLVSAPCFDFLIQQLATKEPRVKWESARTIGNAAALHKNKLGEAVKHLLDNTTHSGTVVRWSTAFALGEILKVKTKLNTDLIPAIESIILSEEKNSIKKIYQDALKKTVK